MTNTVTNTDTTFTRDILVISVLIGLAFALQSPISTTGQSNITMQDIQQRVIISSKSNDDLKVVDISNAMAPNPNQVIASFDIKSLYPSPMEDATYLNMITPAAGGDENSTYEVPVTIDIKE